MKEPDKIYTDNRGVYAELPIFSQADANVEYIRKDALLEWAKSQKARLKQGYRKEYKNDDTLNGGRLMLDKFIEKLNLM